LWSIYIQNYNLHVDAFTFYCLLWNLGAVGVLSVFWHAPKEVKGGYLVLVSMLMAWVVSFLPEWTTWAFMVALSMYDICAVLSPCGPLKALIYLAQTRQEAIPALVYEVEVPDDESQPVVLKQETGLSQPLIDASEKKQAPQSPADVKVELATPSRSESPQSETTALMNAKDSPSEVQSKQPPKPTIMNEAPQQPPGAEPEDDEPRTVKLGLGDFVFYSVLVARGALFGWVAMVSTLVAIVSVSSAFTLVRIDNNLKGSCHNSHLAGNPQESFTCIACVNLFWDYILLQCSVLLMAYGGTNGSCWNLDLKYIESHNLTNSFSDGFAPWLPNDTLWIKSIYPCKTLLCHLRKAVCISSLAFFEPQQFSFWLCFHTNPSKLVHPPSQSR
jgi:hypothetical protein